MLIPPWIPSHVSWVISFIPRSGMVASFTGLRWLYLKFSIEFKPHKALSILAYLCSG